MINKDDVMNLAKLAKFNIEESKLDGIIKDLNGMIAFADEIKKFDTKDIDIDNIYGLNGLYNVMREDVVEKSYDIEQVLINADGGFDGFFSVKR